MSGNIAHVSRNSKPSDSMVTDSPWATTAGIITDAGHDACVVYATEPNCEQEAQEVDAERHTFADLGHAIATSTGVRVPIIEPTSDEAMEVEAPLDEVVIGTRHDEGTIVGTNTSDEHNRCRTGWKEKVLQWGRRVVSTFIGMR